MTEGWARPSLGGRSTLPVFCIYIWDCGCFIILYWNNKPEASHADTIAMVAIFYLSVTDQIQTREYFEHRADKLKEKTFTHRTGWIVEHYKPGRHRCLKGSLCNKVPSNEKNYPRQLAVRIIFTHPHTLNFFPDMLFCRASLQSKCSRARKRENNDLLPRSPGWWFGETGGNVDRNDGNVHQQGGFLVFQTGRVW